MLLRWVLFALAIMFIAWLLPGISVSSIWSALIVTVIIALINMLIRPIVNFITLPLNILTVGLFSFITNALLFMLAGYLSPGFEIDGFWSALLGSIILSIFGVYINKIGEKSN